MKKFFLMLVLAITALYSYAGREAFIIIQNVSAESLNITSSYRCLRGAAINYNSTSPTVVRYRLMDDERGRCFWQHGGTGIITINGRNNISAQISFSISSAATNVTLNNSHGIEVRLRRFSSLNRTHGQDMVGINIVPLKSSNYDSNWMTRNRSLIGNKPLRDILIPGTHDSFAYSLSRTMCPASSNTFLDSAPRPLLARYANAQRLDFMQQLNLGIRYFDVRLCRNFSGVYGTHGLIRPTTIFQDMVGLDRYLQQHPNEIVIFDVNHVYGFNDATARSFLDDVYSRYAKFIAPFSAFGPNSTPNQFYAAKKNLIIMFTANRNQIWRNIANDPKYSWVWPRTAIRSPWNGAIHSNTNPAIQEAFMSNNLNSRSSNSPELFVTQTQFTPNGSFIGSNTNRGLEHVHYQLLESRHKWIMNNAHRMNIYIRDFSLGYDATEVIRANFKNQKPVTSH